jgi:dTDP-4-dehydrorhamnose reductase
MVCSSAGIEIFLSTMRILSQKKCPKILILGRNGMLGSTVFRFFSMQDECVVHGTQRNRTDDLYYFDIHNGSASLRRFFKMEQYDYVINCIGILKTSEESNLEYISSLAKINSSFPHELSHIADDFGVRVINISTDGIFSGKNPLPYLEDSQSDCEDAYGKSKYLGESQEKNAINIRCSIIGKSKIGRGLLEWFLRQKDGSTIVGYRDQIWSGVSTVQFAQLCALIIKENAFDTIRKESHIHHFCPNIPLTKYEFLHILKECTKKNIHVSASNSSYCSSRILGTKFHTIKNIFFEKRNWKEVIYETLNDS